MPKGSIIIAHPPPALLFYGIRWQRWVELGIHNALASCVCVPWADWWFRAVKYQNLKVVCFREWVWKTGMKPHTEKENILESFCEMDTTSDLEHLGSSICSFYGTGFSRNIENMCATLRQSRTGLCLASRGREALTLSAKETNMLVYFPYPPPEPEVFSP